MSQAHNSVVSLLAVVSILALTAIATVLYNDDAAQKAKVDNSFFWQKTRVLFDLALGVVDDVTSISPDSQASQFSDTSNMFNQLDGLTEPIGNSKGFLDNAKSDIQKAWNKNSDNSNNQLTLDNVFEWSPITDGVEIVLRLKSDNEYKFFLPLKFLGK